MAVVQGRLRWLPILSLMLSGAAQAEIADGVWRYVGETGYQTLLVMNEGDHIVFDYVSQSPLSACRVPGYATKQPRPSSGEELFVFRNDAEHQRWDGHFEGYLDPLDEQPPCTVEFSFSEVQVTVRETGGYCKHFCGVRGGIGGTLERISLPQLLK